MSISSEINRISGNVSDALTAIANKGVTVPSGSNSDDLADLIGQISGGGGGTTWETLYEATRYTEDWGEDEYYLNIEDYFQTHSDLIVGDTYRITWQGIQYTQEAFTGTWFSTDTMLGASDSTFTGYPYACQKFNGDDLLFVSNVHTSHFTLKIEHQISSGGSTLITKTITENGTYDAEDDDADGYSEVTVALPSGTAGTPTATKGTVSNHSVSVTPSVTNTAGVITGGTKTGTAVTVTASELASGNKEIVSNGTNIDVVGYSTVSVAVPTSGGKNVQVAHGTKRVASQTYIDVGYEITVAKAGTYNVYWAGWRSSTSGTNGAQLYVNGQESGSAVTSFDANWTNVQNGSRTSVSLTQGDKVTLRARSRGTSYYMYIFFLAIEEV